MARGTVVEVDVLEGGTPSTRIGVVIEARPAGAPTRVKVLWEPISALRVTEHAWPPAQARILGVANLKVARAPRRASGPAEEPIGFAQWLGAHVVEAERHGLKLSVPGAATTRRAKLAGIYARLVGEGHGEEDFRAASIGVLADDFMRQGGHVQPENVLRLEKFGRWVDRGRHEQLARAAAVASGETDWGRFDG